MMNKNTQPVNEQDSTTQSINRKNYLNHKDGIKTMTVIRIVACALVLVSLILFIFLPNFNIDLTQIEILDISLPKFENMSAEELLNTNISFSLLDEFIVLFGVFGSFSTIVPQNPSIFYCIVFEGLAILCLVAALISAAVTLFKDITLLINFEENFVFVYDGFIREEEKHKSKNPSVVLLILAIILEIIGLCYNLLIDGISKDFTVINYLPIMSGLSGASAATIIFLIITFVASGFFAYAVRKEKMKIIKEDYVNQK